MSRSGRRTVRPICRTLGEIRAGLAEAAAKDAVFDPVLVCDVENVPIREAERRVIIREKIYCFDHSRRWICDHREELGVAEVDNFVAIGMLAPVEGRVRNLHQLKIEPRIQF